MLERPIVGNLAADTAVAVIGHDTDTTRLRAALAPDWEIWGPNGGYLSAVMLRAVGVHSRFSRPATFSCHFLGVASFDEVDVAVTTLRAGRVAESLRVTMRQGDRAIAEALVWAVSADADGLAHDHAPLPDVAPPERLEPYRFPEFRFWDNFEHRPLVVQTHDEWMAREPADPVTRGWYRYVPVSVFDDPWVEAGRIAILLDTLNWPAAARAHREKDLAGVYAPSLDVSIQFHRLPEGAEWLFAEATAPVASGGLIGSVNRLWAEDGRLLGTSGQQMLCRT